MTQFNYFGDITAANSLLEKARREMKVIWENCPSETMTMEDIERIENLIRLGRGIFSEIKDIKDKFKAVSILRSNQE